MLRLRDVIIFFSRERAGRSIMALPVFPDQNLSSFIKNFIAELEDDFQSPSISKFQDYMPKCRAGLQAMEEVSVCSFQFGRVLMCVLVSLRTSQLIRVLFISWLAR